MCSVVIIIYIPCNKSRDICCFHIKRSIRYGHLRNLRNQQMEEKELSCQFYHKTWPLTSTTMYFCPHFFLFITLNISCFDFSSHFRTQKILQLLQVNNRKLYGNLGCKTVNIKLNSCCKIVWLKRYTDIE